MSRFNFNFKSRAELSRAATVVVQLQDSKACNLHWQGAKQKVEKASVLQKGGTSQILVQNVYLAMAGPSPFDLLPDEVVTSILAFVGARDEELLVNRGHYARHLLQAQLVCKRFARLVHQVKNLDWPLDSVERSLGFMTFVHHDSFSIETLNLFVTEAAAEELPHDFIFALPLLKRLPETVNLHFILPDDRAPLPPGAEERGPYITLSDPEGNMLESLLLKSRVRNLGVFCPAPNNSLVIEKLRAAPVSLLRDVDLSSATIAIPALRNLLSRCVHLENLTAHVDGVPDSGLGDQDPILVIKSDTLKSLSLSNENFLSVNVQAPNLLCCFNEAEVIHLGTPSLQLLNLHVDHLEKPVTLTEPFSRLERLTAVECRADKCWSEKVVPLLGQCPTLKQLVLTMRESTPDSPLSVGEFLSQLPLGIEHLGVHHGFLQCLSLAKLSAGYVHKHLKELRVAVDDSEFAYLELRALCQGLPNLQKVEFYLRGELDRKGILSLLKSDFKHVPKIDIYFLEMPMFPGTIFQ